MLSKIYNKHVYTTEVNSTENFLQTIQIAESLTL